MYMNNNHTKGRRSLVFALVTITLMMLCFPVFAAPRLVHEAFYEGEFQGININMVRRLWELGDDRFKLETVANNFLGKIEESEEFIWSNEQSITPLNYRYSQRVFGIKRSRKIDYDWQENIAFAKDKKKRKKIILAKNTLGPLTYQLQLQLDVLANKPKLEYRFINKTSVKQYTFVIEEETESETNKLVKVMRTNESSDRSTTIWLNKSDHCTIFKLEQMKSDKSHVLSFTKGTYHSPLANTPYALVASSSDSVKQE